MCRRFGVVNVIMLVPLRQWCHLFSRDRVQWRHLFRCLLALAVLEAVWLLATRTQSALLASKPLLASRPPPIWLRVKREHLRRMVDYDQLSTGRVRFRPGEADVMVFLHMQKTSGSQFGKHLVHHLQLSSRCQCGTGRNPRILRCRCPRPASENGTRHRAGETWLFSSASVGWMCGIHATWTELVSCVPTQLDNLTHQREQELLHDGGRDVLPTHPITDHRRYFYVTWLRDPVQRTLSEWRHVARGATWARARHWCQGHTATDHQLAPCYTPGTYSWVNVSLNDFLACDTNLAHNRQTVMLADLDVVHCYNHSALSTEERERRLLASARANLAAMAFFGITELQSLSQRVFERVFRLRFGEEFQQHWESHAQRATNTLTQQQLRLIRRRNRLDLQLYAFARELLQQREKRLVDREAVG